ncbi:MAG TPA: serine/threonine-protein kinase [Kofleriaceae bacterium]|jgi:serine/threonine-protein kinase
MAAMSAVPSTERYCPTCERSFRDTKRCPDDGTELVVLAGTQDPLIGRNLNDRYTIQSRLGAGGMGTVYRAMQHSVGREVAVKVVNPRLINDAEATKRFLREAKVASRFNHPNAVGVLDFGQTDDGLFFLAMELLEGKTLDTVLRDDGRFSLDRIGTIAGQICDALEAAHKIMVVHRDLKPANVILLDTQRDFVKVLDFGLAKSLSPDSSNVSMTNSGALLGTPAFMSPEAALGREVDARADLYSLGVMIYVLASGRLPFNATTTPEMLAMQANEAPPRPPGIPEPVANVIMKLLAKEPADRYESAAATRKALDEAIATTKKSTAITSAATLPQGSPIIDLPASGMASTVISSPGNASTVASASDAAPSPPVRAASVGSMADAPRIGSRRLLYIAGVIVLFFGLIALKKKLHVRVHAEVDDREQLPSLAPSSAPDADAVTPATTVLLDAAPVVVDAAPAVVVDAAAPAAVVDAPPKPVAPIVKKHPRPQAGSGSDAPPPW